MGNVSMKGRRVDTGGREVGRYVVGVDKEKAYMTILQPESAHSIHPTSFRSNPMRPIHLDSISFPLWTQ